MRDVAEMENTSTAISQVLACGLAIGAVSRQKCYLHMSLRDDFRPCRREIGEIARIGLPAALEQFMMRIGSLIFSKEGLDEGHDP